MFQVSIGPLVLIAFVWGPLVNGGIQMGSVVYGPQIAHVYVSSKHMGLFTNTCEHG